MAIDVVTQAVPGTSPSVATTTYAITTTTSLTITIPTVSVDDILILHLVNRDATADPTVTDDDTGGNAWAKIISGNDGTSNASVWWKRATSATSAKTITASGFTGSCAGGLAVFSGVDTGATPYENASYESNASNNEAHAGFTPSVDNCRIFLCVFNATNDIQSASFSSTNPGALTQNVSVRSTGGLDCETEMASANQTTATATGNLTWSQANAASMSIVFALKPAAGGGTTIAIGVGTLSLTSYAVSLNTSQPIASGTLTLNGVAPSLNSGLGLEVGSLSLTGYVGTLGFIVPITVGNLSFTGYSLTTNLQLALQVGNLSLTGFSPSLAESVTLSIGSGALSLTGYSSTLDNQFDFGAQGTLSLTGYAFSVSTGAQTIPIGSNTLLFTNFAPGLVVTAIEVGLGQLMLSGSTPSLNEQFPMGSSDVLLAGLAPTLQTAQPILYGALTLFGLAPSLATSTSEIAISQGALSFSGYAVSLITGYPTVDIGVGGLSINGFTIGVEQLLLIRSNNLRSDASLTSVRPDMSLFSKRTST